LEISNQLKELKQAAGPPNVGATDADNPAGVPGRMKHG
jgi:hypothetical protein